MSGVGSTLTTVGSALGSAASSVAAGQTGGVVHGALAFTGFALGGYAVVIGSLMLLGGAFKLINRKPRYAHSSRRFF